MNLHVCHLALQTHGSSFCVLWRCVQGPTTYNTPVVPRNFCVFAAHIKEKVFKRLKAFNLKIKPNKCHFFQHSVVFLGHALSADGISANPEKDDKVKNRTVPKGNTFFPRVGIRLSAFVPSFAAKAKILHQ